MTGRRPILRLGDGMSAAAVSTGRSKPPSPPKMLDVKARREWRRLIREMPDGLIGQLDRAQLAVHCVAWSTFVAEVAELAKSGPVITSPSGYPMLSPHWTVFVQCSKVIDRTGAELGLSPISRTRIKSATPKRPMLAGGRKTVGA